MAKTLSEIVNQLDEGIRQAETTLDSGTRNAWLELMQWFRDQGIHIKGTD
jgi:hypothetical protein